MNTKERTAIVWDEAAVTSYSRDFMTRMNKDVNKFFQIFGYRRLAVIATFQILGMLDSELRGQLDCVFWCRSRDYRDDKGEPYTRKFMMPFKVTKTPFWPPYIQPWDYLPTTQANYVKIGWLEVPPLEDALKVYGVKPSFIKDYLKRKQEFFENLGKEEENETPKIDKRWLQTMQKKEDALKAGIDYMATKL